MNRAPTSTMEAFDSPPAVSRDVLQWLQKAFPNALPRDPNISDRELGALFGEQRVIDHLASILQHQEEDILNHV